jgi:hypothetical protein
MYTKKICGLIVAVGCGGDCCVGGFFGIEEWKSDQGRVRGCDSDEHQLPGKLFGTNL